MEFPLAHDENGCPVEVPANANGWLVRRHAGGRGRPAAVYDGEGRPLVVPLDSTVAELRLHGCRAATYRLDAVDDGRRLLGVTAYTEVSGDGVEDDGGGTGGSGRGDAAVAALARAVEAMQRVQAERERAQAERERAQADMLARLIERLAPPPPVVHRNAPEVLREFSDVQKFIKKMAPEDSGSGEGAGGNSTLEIVNGIVDRVAEIVLPVLEMRQKQAQGAPVAPAAVVEEEPEEEVDEEEEAETGDAVDARLDEVFSLLTDEEAAEVRRMTATMPEVLKRKVLAELMTMTSEEAVVRIRAWLESKKDDAPKAEQKGAA